MEEQRKFKHLMVDLETFGKTSDSIITSIAAVPFNMDMTIGEPFEAFPDIEEQIGNRKIEWSTIKWWMEQEESARFAVTKPDRSRSLKACLMNFSLWALSKGLNPEFVSNLDPKFKVWSNGAAFDIAMMNHAFDQYKIQKPWSYRNEFDCRTMVYLSKISTCKYQACGIKHNAIDDCKWQISWLVDAYNIVKNY